MSDKWPIGTRVKIVDGKHAKHAHCEKTGVIVSYEDISHIEKLHFRSNDIIVEFDDHCVTKEKFCFFFDDELQKL